jgi:hypothetical protein
MVSMGQLNKESLKETSERSSSGQDSHNPWTHISKIHEMRVESAKWHIGTLRHHTVNLDSLSHIHESMSKNQQYLKGLPGHGQ